ncbi:MAG TPA: putative DNA binding domain-containing protein [Ignavibacteria bacterium]|nr:putative DNA binding domain-containing protein [Ignavibacteria bacterium]HMQ98170.1 putative DNA binding domain-containing protein [Ignavibacteria bacterium]
MNITKNSRLSLYELNELIEGGENQNVEFKRKFTEPEKIAKEMLAFANTHGGRILFGIDDDKSVVGVESEKGEIEYIDLAARFFCEPEIKYTVDIMYIYRKDVIIVNIPESFQKPHRLIENGKSDDDETKVYIRVKDRSVQASKETIKVLKKLRQDAPPQIINLGDKEKALIDYLQTHERVTLKEFREFLNLSNRRASRILVNLVRADIIRLHNHEREDFYTLN